MTDFDHMERKGIKKMKWVNEVVMLHQPTVNQSIQSVG